MSIGEAAQARLASNQPFPIHDPGKAWLIRSGTLDLYLVRLNDAGESTGPRHHVARFAEGALVLGMNLPEVAPWMGLIGCAGPDSHIVEVDRTQLQSAPKRELAAWLDDWIASLSAAAATAIPPRVHEPLESGKGVSAGKEGKAVLPREGVVWVKHLQGSSHLLGELGLNLPGDALFPLASPAWLQIAPSTRLMCADTAEFLHQDPQWSGLHRFHEAVMRCLVSNLLRNEQKECERLQARSKADDLTVDAALRRLMSPLQAESQAAAPGPQEGQDPLLLACQAIGSVSGIRFRLPPGTRDAMAQRNPVANLARASSVRFRQVVLEATWWRRDAGPLLAFRESDQRPLALLPVAAGKYQLFDPVERTRVAVNQAVAKSLAPFAYMFYRPFPAKRLAVPDLLTFGLKGCGRDAGMVLAMGIGTGVLGMLTPILTGVIFDTIIPGAQQRQLMQMFLMLVASAVCLAMLHLTRGFALLRLETRMDVSVQAGVWDRLLSLPVPFFRDYSSGDLAVRSLGINEMQRILTASALESIFSGLFSVFSFALLFYYSWRLAVVATGLVAAAFAASTFGDWRWVRYQRSITHLRGRISGMVLQFINGIAKFRVSGTEHRAFASWAGEFTRQKELALKARKVANNLAVFQSVLPIASSACIFYCVSGLLKQPDTRLLSTGEFLAFNAAFGQFLAAALSLSRSLTDVLAVVPYYERARPILETLPEVDQAKADPGELSGNVEIGHVAFRYRADTPLVLRDVSLSISAGQFVAFVGASGCGKSTLFRLLLGFETPESGAIFYDGQDLAGLDVQAVRRQLGVVLQNGKLFSGSIFENIRGSAAWTIDDAWQAARMAGFEQDIRQMPMGMHTVVGEGGGGLSGGQRQRLMVARAIVGKPRILLFDEATSALDNQTQAIVSRSLESLQATRIVIAHRLSTVMHADRIIVLDKGMVVQSGTYAELMEQGGFFAELARRQLT